MPTVIAPAPTIRRRPGGPPRPAIRLRPAPALEPPFDDETASPTWAGPGADQLTLDLGAGSGAGSPAPVRPAGRVAVAEAVAGASAESIGAVRRFVRLCLEIFNGYRPAGHVRPLTNPAYAAGVVEQIGLARLRVAAINRRAARPVRAAVGPARAVPRRATPGNAQVGLRRLRVCEPRAGVAEAAVVLSTGGMAVAMAVRLELQHGRWLCAAARIV
jgi:hypothetical protein